MLGKRQWYFPQDFECRLPCSRCPTSAGNDCKITPDFGDCSEVSVARASAGARERAAAGRGRCIVQVLDNAGWHGEVGLDVREGIRLVFQPADTSEVQPAEALWTLVDELADTKHIPTFEDLDEINSALCTLLASEREKIKSHASIWTRQRRGGRPSRRGVD